MNLNPLSFKLGCCSLLNMLCINSCIALCHESYLFQDWAPKNVASENSSLYPRLATYNIDIENDNSTHDYTHAHIFFIGYDAIGFPQMQFKVEILTKF